MSPRSKTDLRRRRSGAPVAPPKPAPPAATSPAEEAMLFGEVLAADQAGEQNGIPAGCLEAPFPKD
ncbi:MAG TPA: hypothetical protein VGH90_07180 [Chthoniobacteraceae bacterium]